jgi:hypothetical protein
MILNSTWILIFVAFLPGGGQDTDAVDVWKRARTATSAVMELTPRGRGSGVYEHRYVETYPKQVVESHEIADFEMMFEKPKNRIQLTFRVVDNKQPEWETAVILHDGKAAYRAQFVNRHAEGIIEQLEAEGQLPAELFPVGFDLLPQAFNYYLLRDDFPKEYTLLIRDEPDGRKILSADHKEHHFVEEFTIDPAAGFNVVAYRYIRPDGRVVIACTKEFHRYDQSAFVRLLEYKTMSKKKDFSSDDTVRIELQRFEPNVEIPAAAFTIDGLGLPPGSKLQDRRSSPWKNVNIGVPQTDRRELEKAIGELRRPPHELPPPAAGAVPFPQNRRFWTWFFLAGGGLAVFSGVFLRIRQRKVNKQG